MWRSTPNQIPVSVSLLKLHHQLVTCNIRLFSLLKQAAVYFPLYISFPYPWKILENQSIFFPDIEQFDT